jgi:hypothetical protein
MIRQEAGALARGREMKNPASLILAILPVILAFMKIAVSIVIKPYRTGDGL